MSEKDIVENGETKMSNIPAWWQRKPWWAKLLILTVHPLMVVVYLLLALGWAAGLFE